MLVLQLMRGKELSVSLDGAPVGFIKVVESSDHAVKLGLELPMRLTFCRADAKQREAAPRASLELSGPMRDTLVAVHVLTKRHARPPSQSALWLHCNVAAGTMTERIRRARDLGWLTRDSGPHSLAITPLGHDVLKRHGVRLP